LHETNAYLLRFARIPLLLIPFKLAGLLSKQTHLSAELTAKVLQSHLIHLAESICISPFVISGVIMQHMHCWQYRLSNPVFPLSHHFLCLGTFTCTSIVMCSLANNFPWL
jgi:hypothetical protein